MPEDPALPPSLASVVRGLQERVRNLEMSPRLTSASIKGGQLRVYDAGDVQTLRLGEQADGANGLTVYAEGGSASILSVTDEHGFGSPWLSVAWKKANDFVAVTSGTFVTTWETDSELVWSDQMLFRVVATTDAATTGELRLYNASSAAAIGGTRTLGAGSTTYDLSFRVEHGLTLGTGPHFLQVQARRTSGANNVNVYCPMPLHLGSNMSPVAGGWS